MLYLIGKWFPLKKLVFMILLGLRKRKQKTAASKSGGPGYGVKSRSSIDEMDCVQPLCDDKMVTPISDSAFESKLPLLANLSITVCK